MKRLVLILLPCCALGCANNERQDVAVAQPEPVVEPAAETEAAPARPASAQELITGAAPVGERSASAAVSFVGTSANPTRDELPDLRYTEVPRSSMSVGVEEFGSDRPRRLLVPKLAPIEPTPEELAILGPPPKKPELDELVFYRGQLGDGVIPFEGGRNSAVYLETRGGGGVGQASGAVGGVDAYSGHIVVPNIGSFMKAYSGVYTETTGAGMRYTETGVSVGHGPPSYEAGASSRLDP